MRIFSRFCSVARLPCIAAVVTLTACGGGGDGATTPVVDNTPATITLSPATPATIVSGATLTLSATVRAKDGRALATAVAWTS